MTTDPYTPAPKVQFAPGYTGPFTTVPTSAWVDISAYASFTNPDRGRSSELELFSAATCTFTLEADDRRFDPLNADGPYFGQLAVQTPFRLLATVGGVDHALWYGYADAWRHRPTTFTSTVDVPCTDGFKVLAGQRLPQSVYELALLADSPRALWRLGESGDVLTDVSGNRFDGVYFAAHQVGQSVVPYSNVPGVASNPIFNALGSAPSTALFVPGFNPVSVELWVQMTATPQAEQQGVLMVSSSVGSTSNFRIAFLPPPTVSTAGGEIAIRFGNLGVNPQRNFQVNVFDGAAHQIVFTRNGDTVKCYVDGLPVPELSATSPTTFTDYTGQVWFGPYTPFDATKLFEGLLSYVTVWAAVELTAAQVLTHYQAATQPWSGDTTGARVGRVLDAIGWPAALRDIDDGEVLVQPADFGNLSALDYLQLLASTEGGRLFMAADGKLTFHAADRTVTGTSTYTFDGAGVLLDDGLTLSLDDSFLFDAAVVQRKYGSPQRAGAATATATYELDGILSLNDAVARQRAERIAFRYADARTRIDGWTAQPEHVPADWATILDLELGDVVTVEATPAGAGDPVTVDLFIERISHRIGTDDWTIDYWGSPVDDTDYFTWGGDGATQGWGFGVWR